MTRPEEDQHKKGRVLEIRSGFASPGSPIEDRTVRQLQRPLPFFAEKGFTHEGSAA
jgi:hypothetical protein